MTKTSIRQKIALVVLGVVLCFFILEIGLRIAGGVVLFLQEKHNRISNEKGNYRILCLGESTTALGGEDSYPSQLEKALNEQTKGKNFSVINKGLVSTTTDYILAHADQNLDLYKPQLVIIMMGINDYAYPRPSQMPLWLWRTKLFVEDFKVYKLFKLLYQHITHKVQETKNPSPFDHSSEQVEDYHFKENFLKQLIAQEMVILNSHMAKSMQYEKDQRWAEAKTEREFMIQAVEIIKSAYIDLARRYVKQGLLSEAQDNLEEAAKFQMNDLDYYQVWGELYLAQGKAQEAAKAFQKAIFIKSTSSDALLGMARAYYMADRKESFLLYMDYLNKNPSEYWGYIELAGWFRKNTAYVQAIEYLNKAIELQPVLEKAYLDLGAIYDELGEYKKEEEFYLNHIKNNEKVKVHLIQALGQFYQRQGKEDLASKYLKQAAQLGLKEYTPWTWSNYNLLIKKIAQRGIKIIVMQYPLRSIDPIKSSIEKKDQVVFVENRSNFKKALTSGRFSDYFSDNFAYDFGHCTRLGNQLIAQNLVPVVLKISSER